MPKESLWADWQAHPVRLARAVGLTRLREEVHDPWLRQMVLGQEDMTLLAHRGSYKTTCLSLAMAMLLVLCPQRNILFLRKTESGVVEVLRRVKALLAHPVFSEWAAAAGHPAPELRKTDRFTVETQQYASINGAPQLLGQGIDGTLTGKHADLVITDDMVDLSDRLSPVVRQHTREIFQELYNIRNPGGRILCCGTPWHPEDALTLMPEPVRYDCYTTGLLSPEEIDRLRHRMTPSLFAANYELRHIAAEDILFPETPETETDETRLYDGICHVDAAYGGGDCTAMTCGRRIPEGILLYGRLWNRPADEVIPQIAAECARLRCSPVYCETNGDKGYFARELRRQGLIVRTYAERQNKTVKIAGYLRKAWPHVKLLAGCDPAWLRQIHGYSDSASAGIHDDAPDSAASLVRILERQIR